MNVNWLIAKREISERVKTRSFIITALLGPVVVLLITYALFLAGGDEKDSCNILIADPTMLLDNKIMPDKKQSVNYVFINKYIELKTFEKESKYKVFDALLEVNEKILINKSALFFYRKKPSLSTSTSIHLHLERRIEELIVSEHSKMTIQEYRKIKQPINIGFRNIYDPTNESANLSAWVGFFFGAIILFFILLFGMTILRSVSNEKSNRIVEVLLASVKPRQLMFGKIAGIGIVALFQFIVWIIIVAIGLKLMRIYLFPDLLDTSNWDVVQLTNQAKQDIGSFKSARSSSYNDFVQLVFERIKYGNMLFYFVLFFITGYIFYGTFFATLGAAAGSENDGQQFIIPIVLLLFIALFGGYYAMTNPDSSLTFCLSFIPFTAPMVCMVKIAQGYSAGESYQLVISFGILTLSSLLVLRLAGRLYTNGILQFGHRLKLSQFIKWLKHE